jgi:membrane protease YdiL (CAAX protease family)
VTSTTWESRPELPDGAPPPSERAEQAWQPWTAPIALLSALVVAFIGGAIIAVVGVAFGYDLDDTPPGVLMGATFIQDLGFVGAAILFARMTGATWASQFGLRPTRLSTALIGIVALYVGFLIFAAIWQTIIHVPEDSELLDQLGVEQSTAALIGAMIMVCVAAPVVEEFFFRGFFFTALRNWRGLWPAAIGTGVVFGAIHLGSSPAGALVPLAVLGFGLCLLYAWTGSLYPCIAVHAINNSIAFGTLNDWTWGIPVLLVGSLVACFAIAIPIANRWRPPAPRLNQPSGPAPAAGLPG